MPTRSFQAKLLALLIGLLLLLQTGVFVSVHVAGQQMLHATLRDELAVGARVLDRLLQSRGRQLSDTVRVLAADFAFREAVAAGDRATIVSVLNNHGSRIRANTSSLIALDGMLLADTSGAGTVGKPFPFPSLIRTAAVKGEASSIVSLAGRPHQLVVVPILAPRTIGYVSMGFPIDAGVLDDVRRLTSLKVSLWNDFARPGDKAALDGEKFESLVEPLRTDDGSRVNALFQRSLEEARKPYTRLERRISVLSSLGLCFSILAAAYFARTVSKPLRGLAEGARRIEHADYSYALDIRQRDEIGQLATAFNRMRKGIADREEKITHQATHDALTGLPNRALFADRLRQAITSAKRTGNLVGVLMMDLDRFKEVNDTLGHHFGDLLLVEVGQRLKQALRESDTVARLGGDEFAVTFTTHEATHAAEVARKIHVALETPLDLSSVLIDVKASVGIAIYPTHAQDAGALIQRADVAMYEAKQKHSEFAVYEPGRDDHSLRRLSLMSELRHAVVRDELELVYQPKIDMHSGRMIHVEALARWRHPQHGLLPPDEFVPLAEQSGNIGVLTKWVLRTAIRQCAEWNSAGLDLTMAVNLSALDLLDSELPSCIMRLLAEADIKPSRLVLEITESAVMRDPLYALRILRDLKQKGLRLAIDDFGTGYSSLAHLKELPVDELKIDKSFVVGLPGEDTSIVRTTIELGHNMGLKVIAEGVENAASLEMLKNFGCDMAQGYFMCPPLPPAELLRWNRESIWGRKSDVVLDQARDLLSARDIPGLAVATEEQAKTAPNDAESATSTARPTAAP